MKRLFNFRDFFTNVHKMNSVWLPFISYCKIMKIAMVENNTSLTNCDSSKARRIL